jgi:hypothetical protein
VASAEAGRESWRGGASHGGEKLGGFRKAEVLNAVVGTVELVELGNVVRKIKIV